ncbi:MAG TPA: M56 family metallopeptidase [Terracidiphilus sp.]|jgi:TonB family protein|nr:M56 family metallopeptidase [Terracidiphilus sp.]
MMHAESWLLSYLLNSLWQVPLVFAAGWLAARLLRHAGPAAEHRLWVGVLLLESALPALSTLPWERAGALAAAFLGTFLGTFLGAARGADAQVTVTMSGGTAAHAVHLPGALSPGIALAYCAALLYFAARLVWQWQKLHSLRREASPMTLSGGDARCWARCEARFGIADASLARSPKLFGPVTLGIRDKLVLLPANMAGKLTAAEMETVIAHEFAHMRRNDFLKNLLYELLTLPVSYHPLCRVARERVTETREMLCDQLAAEMSGRTHYARSLLRLAGRLIDDQPMRTAQAIGIFDTNTFERRIMKLSETTMEVGGARRLAILAICAALGTGTVASALALRMHVDAATVANSMAADEAPGRVTVPAGEMAGHLTKRVQPQYPADAKKAHVKGTVVLDAVIGKDGKMQDLKVRSGPQMLRQSSLDAVQQWEYEPYLLNGNAVEVTTTINVTYSLGK